MKYIKLFLVLGFTFFVILVYLVIPNKIVVSKTTFVHQPGNLVTNAKGESKMTFHDHMIKLRGTKCNIIGRGLIIHADPDDLGEGGHSDSLITGHAGKRIACAVIGFAKGC